MNTKNLMTLIVILGISLGIAIGMGVRSNRQAKAANKLLTEMTALNDDINKSLREKDAKVTMLLAEKSQVESALGALHDQNKKKIDEVEASFREQLKQKEVQITRTNETVTLGIDNRVLFDSGKVVIKPDGLDILRKIAETMKASDQFAMRIEGHTDDVPTQFSYPSNWELSTARACAAIKFLIEEGKISPSRLTAVGYADTRPLVPNVDDESRAKNRRIEVVVMQKNQAQTPPSPNPPGKP